MTKILMKPKNDHNTPLNLKNDWNTPETYKIIKISLNLKITKIPHKPKKWLKYSWKVETYKMTKIPHKSKR